MTICITASWDGDELVVAAEAKMSDYKLRIGMRFIRKGRDYVIEGRLPSGDVKFRDALTGASFAAPDGELIKELFDGNVELLGEDGCRQTLKEKLARARVTDIGQLADDDPLKIEIVRRFNYIKELMSAQPLPRTEKNLIALIQRVCARISDPRPPSWTTLNRWFRAYDSAGRDVRALAPLNKACGNRRSKISGRVPDELTDRDYEKARAVSAIADRVIRTKYLTIQRPSVQSVYQRVVNDIDKENRHRDAEDRLPIPHVSTVYKIINKLDPYETDRARFGKKYADGKHRANAQGPRPSRPLERVECDHTKVDLMVIDEKTRLPLGRPWLTALIDVYTKMVLGIYLGFHRPGSLSAAQCLLHAIRPKSYVREFYPRVQHDWPAYGIPELIVVDNAKEFHGTNFRDACWQLGTEIDYSPPGRPWFRPTVERWYGTLNKSLLHELPGTTFSNIFDKKDYDPEKHAVISLKSLLEITHIWIADVYHQREHKGIRDIPYRRWMEGIAKDPPNLPPNSEELKILLGFVELRCVSRSGIELFTLLYNSIELGLLRRRLGEGQKVTVKYDPTDISVIHVWDDYDGRYIRVPALDQEYTRGLTIWQHHIIRRYARRLVREHVDIIALCRAKKLIQEIVEGERLLRGRVGGMQKIAHYLNLGQPNYQEAVGAEGRPSPNAETRQLPQGKSDLEVSREVGTCWAPQSSGSSCQIGSGETVRQTVSDTEENFSAAEEGWGADYDLPCEE